MGKYHHLERTKSSYVWFKLLDKAGKTLKDYPQAACFAQIAYSTVTYPAYGMHKDTKTIHVYRSKDMMPYNVPEIKRWIADLNEMGFPCRFADDGIVGDAEKQKSFVDDTMVKGFRKIALALIRHGGPEPIDPNQFYNFYVDIKDYKDKSHLFSTLTLIRTLSESYMDKIPEIYFEMLDKDPKADKFQALQDAHKGTISGGGHAVTFAGNGKNITHDALMKKFKKRKADLWKASLEINSSWNGS